MGNTEERLNSNMDEEKYRTLAYDTALSTLLAVVVYVVVKVSLDGIRQWRARVSVLVVGSGPVGLTAALVAVRSGKVLKLTVLDERYRTALLCRPQQIALDPRSVKFLLRLGVDFDNMEGCWHNDHFFTKIGVFQEYLLSILEHKKQKVDIKINLGTKFTEDYLKKIPAQDWPRIIVVADGSCGESCSVLGISSDYIVESCNAYGANAAIERLDQRQFTEDYLKKIPAQDWPRIIVVADGSCGESCSVLGISSDYIVESCNAYGANAAIERLDQRQVPTPEIRAHSLYFDLSAYGVDLFAGGKDQQNSQQASVKPGFHLKIYGTFRNRYMALACPASDSRVVRFLRHTANSSIMKNIFHQSFNAYKTDIEARVNDLTLHHLQCSRRLFEIMLSHRRINAAYIEGDNVAVTIEGEAVRVLNFDTAYM
ncbi:UNVERIFIED_CONTAM: hypothetical protein FKN15_046897 [Acipenser sinensis]